MAAFRNFCPIIVISFFGCLSAGTHGSIKAYKFAVSASRLHSAVDQAISSNQNIIRSISIAWNDSTKEDYYNDGISYITFSIKGDRSTVEYTLHFVEAPEILDSTKESELSIAYACDNEGNGGSKGRGDFPWYKFELRKEVTSLLENDFLNKVDSLLGKKHEDGE
jgi:hypothetical protein